MQAVPQNHPSPEQLAAFNSGKLNAVNSDDVERHLAECPACCETLLGMLDDTLVALLRDKDTAPAVSIAPTVAPEAQQATEWRASAATQGEGGAAVADELPPELRDHSRYRILERVGRGGMGDVYKAEHKVMNRLVALKVIKPHLVQSDAAVRRFRREVQAAARLHHPHIVTAYDAEQAGDLHYLVMEFVDGVSLDEVVRRRGPLPIEEACDYIRQTALALEHAHELGMIHRDIKPHNVMVVQSGKPVESGKRKAESGEDGAHASAFRSPLSAFVKVLDFGLAGFVNEAAVEEMNGHDPQHPAPAADVLMQLTQMGVTMGTPDYIAPEQAQDAHTADIRSDIYSLGCTFYILLAGRTPFGGGSVIEKIKAHTEQDPPPLSGIRPDVPPDVEEIVKTMMAKDPAERYQTPAEVVDALQRFIDERVEAALRERGAGAAPPRATTPVGLAEESGGRKHLYSAANGLMAVGLLNVIYMPFFVYNIDALMRSPWPVWLKIPFLICSSFALPWGLLMMQGAWRMMNRQSYRWSLAAAIMAVIPLTPVNLVLGLAFGVWALLLLVRPEVKAEFGYEIPVSLKSKSRVSEKPASSLLRPLATTAILFFSFALTAGVVIFVEMGKATVKFEIEDPSLTVRFRGETITVESDGKPIRIRPHDEQHVLVQRGDSQTQAASFTLNKGDNVVLRVAVVTGNPLIIPSPRGAGLALKQHPILEPGPPEETTPDQLEQLTLVRKLEGHRYGGAGHQCLAASADGRFLLSAGGPQAMLWDAATGKLLRTFVGPKSGVQSVALSADGRHAAGATSEGEVYLWDRQTGRILRTTEHGTKKSAVIAFTPDSRLLAAASGDGDGLAWDVATGEVVARHDFGKYVWDCLALTDNRTVAVAVGSEVRYWNLEDGQVVTKLDCPLRASCVSLAMSADERTLLVGAKAFGGAETGNVVQVWDTTDWREVQRFTGHTATVSSVAFLPGERHIVSGGSDGRIIVWDRRTGRAVARTEGLGHLANAVVPVLDGTQVASFGGWYDEDEPNPREKDFDVRLWRLPESVWPQLTRIEKAAIVPAKSDVIDGMSLSHDGATLAVIGWDSQVDLFDVRNPDDIRKVASYTTAIHDHHRPLALSPDGKWFVAPGEKGLDLRETSSGKILRPLAAQRNLYSFVAFTPDGKTVLTAPRASSWGPVVQWDVATGDKIRAFPIDANDVVQRIVISPDGRYFALQFERVHSRREHLVIWDIETARPARKLPHAGATAADFLPNRREVVTWSPLDRQLRFWRLADGRETRSAPMNRQGQLFVLPGGKSALVASNPPEGSIIYLVDLETGHELDRVAAEDHIAQRVAVSPDGLHVFSAGGFDSNSRKEEDHDLHVWRLLPESDSRKPADAPPELQAAGGDQPSEYFQPLAGDQLDSIVLP